MLKGQLHDSLASLNAIKKVYLKVVGSRFGARSNRIATACDASVAGRWQVSGGGTGSARSDLEQAAEGGGRKALSLPREEALPLGLDEDRRI